MQQTIEQLQRVGSRARLWLFTLRASTWGAWVLAIAMMLAVADFLLRLPSWPRLILGVVGAAVAIYFAITRIGRALKVRPALTSLALRLERMQPQARGRLASAVAFATARTADESPVAAAMASRTADEGSGAVSNKQVNALLDPSRPLRALCVMMIMVLAVGGVAIAAPAEFNTAVRRWATPFSDAKWPNRYGIESRVTQDVAPNNAPLRAAAKITKGDYPTLRAWVTYRFYKQGEPVGEPQQALMTRQNDAAKTGWYERLIEPAPEADEVRITFEAGDDVTIEQSVQLIEPPTIAALIAEVTPPAYAEAIIPVERHDLLKPATASVAVTALHGSRVTLHVKITGSFTPLEAASDSAQVQQWVRDTLAGLLDAPKLTDGQGQPGARDITYELLESNGVDAFKLGFTLASAVQFRFTLADEFGTRYEDQRVFAIDSRSDALPRATVFEPGSDQQVLATAKLDLAAEAHDDVAVRRLALTHQVNQLEPAELGAEEPAQPTARIRSELDLQPLGLKPGDEVRVAAVVRDNFLLDGAEHEPVTSTPRVIRIISDADLVAQLRVDLAELRQRAIRAKANQSELTERTAQGPDRGTAEQQRQLAERVGAMQRAVQGLRDRADRNRLEDDTLRQMIDEAGKLTRDAGKQAEQAAAQLARATQSDTGDPTGAQQQPGEQNAGQQNQGQQQNGEQSQAGQQQSGQQQSGQQQSGQQQAGQQQSGQQQSGQQQSGQQQSGQQQSGQQQSGQQQSGQQQSGQQQSGQQQQAGQQSQQQKEQTAQAQEHQKQTEAELGKLVDLLDQGGDLYELKQELTSALKDQQANSDKTRKAMPNTLGKTKDQLDEQSKKDLDDIAKTQEDLAERVKELSERMRAASAAIARQSSKPESQAAAESMKRAAQKASDKSLSQQMSKAGQQAQNNQLAQAQQNQSGAEQTLQEMLDELNKTEQIKAEILRRKLAQLVDAIQKLLERQQAQLDRLEKAQNIAGLDEPQVVLRRNTMDVAAEARETDEDTVAVAQHLDAAADDQANAVEAMRLVNPSKPEAVNGETSAVAHLEDALKLAQELSNKAQEEAAENERAKLAEAYKKVLEKQQAINGDTAELDAVADADRDRRWQAKSRALSERQDEVRAELAELQQKLTDTVVYDAAHKQLDAWCASLVKRLLESKIDPDTRFEQEMVEVTITALIDSLKPEPPSDEFAEDDGGGGGGGGTPGKPPLVPPMAELKMLKARQMIVYNLTRMADEKRDISRAVIDSVADQQKDVAQTGAKMLESLERQQQAQPPVMRPGGEDAPLEPQPKPEPAPGPVPGPSVNAPLGFAPSAPAADAAVCQDANAGNELDDLLDLDTPKPQPKPDKPEGEEPAAPDAPKPDKATEDKQPPAENLAAAIFEMKQAGVRLSDADASLPTQRLQERAMRRIDQLIADARKKQSQSSQQQQQQQQQDTGQEPAAGPPQQGQGQAQQNQGQEAATQAGSRGSIQNRGDTEPLEEALSEWGHLPPRVRDQILQSQDDRFSELYRAMTERFYKRLAEENR